MEHVLKTIKFKRMCILNTGLMHTYIGDFTILLPGLSLDVHQGHLHLLSGLLYHEHIQGKDTERRY